MLPTRCSAIASSAECRTEKNSWTLHDVHAKDGCFREESARYALSSCPPPWMAGWTAGWRKTSTLCSGFPVAAYPCWKRSAAVRVTRTSSRSIHSTTAPGRLDEDDWKRLRHGCLGTLGHHAHGESVV
jgi:hypothetical protein